MTSIDDERDPQAQRLERMKNEFLVAQQRRREGTAASRRRDAGDGDGPPLAGPVADGQVGIARDPDAMQHVNLRLPVGGVIATVAARLRDWWHREDASVSLRIAPPDEAGRPFLPRTCPRTRYLDRRFAVTVVLTFEQIEALLGFAPPPPAFADAEWWTGASEKGSPLGCMDRRASQRSPPTGARIVAFERVP